MQKMLLIALFFANLFSAQNQRFTYEYKYVIDSTKKDQVEAELMDLDITAKGSKFASSDKKIADSTSAVRQKNNPGSYDMTGIKFGKVKEVVEKSYPDYTTNLYINLDMNTYKVGDLTPMIWQIQPQQEKVENWNTQKATIDRYGRKWTAWFSADLPLQDGPYKFHGLPGLIVKISDATESHVFTLKEIKNLPKEYDWQSTDEKNSYNKPIALKGDKFKKVHQNYRKDPVAGFRQMMTKSGMTIEMQDEKGNILDIKKEIIDQEKNMKESFIKNNNLLELYLLK